MHMILMLLLVSQIQFSIKIVNLLADSIVGMLIRQFINIIKLPKKIR